MPSALELWKTVIRPSSRESVTRGPLVGYAVGARVSAPNRRTGEVSMSLSFAPGDDLLFQVESGFGLMRVLAAEGEGRETVWHVLVYEDFYPDVESAEAALQGASPLSVRTPHLPLTDRALERTPAARLGNRAVADDELKAYRAWRETGGEVFDRSVLQMLGIR